METTIAKIVLRMEKHAKTAAAAQSAVVSAFSTLMAYLREQKVNNLQTAMVQLHDRSGPSVSPPPESGRYSAINRVSFEVPVGQCGLILDGAVESGATRIECVSFRATSEANGAARENAITDALNDAKREANITTAALGLKLGSAMKVILTDTFEPETRVRLGGSLGMGLFAEKVRARVSMTFELA